MQGGCTYSCCHHSARRKGCCANTSCPPAGSKGAGDNGGGVARTGQIDVCANNLCWLAQGQKLPAPFVGGPPCRTGQWLRQRLVPRAGRWQQQWLVSAPAGREHGCTNGWCYLMQVGETSSTKRHLSVIARGARRPAHQRLVCQSSSSAQPS